MLDCLAARIGAGSWRLLLVVIEESRLRVRAGLTVKLTGVGVGVGVVCCCSELGGCGESCF